MQNNDDSNEQSETWKMNQRQCRQEGRHSKQQAIRQLRNSMQRSHSNAMIKITLRVSDRRRGSVGIVDIAHGAGYCGRLVQC